MSLTRIGSIGINTGIAFAGVTTIVTLNTANDALSIGATVNVGSGITLGASGDIFATGVSTVTTLKVGSGVTVSSDGDIFATGVCTATSFSGSGANLTGIDTDLVSDTSPQLGGNLDVNTKNILFGDSSDGSSDDVLKFGAGSDLSLYHTGTNSYIKNTTNILYLASDQTNILNAAANSAMAKFYNGAQAELYYNNTKRLETTNTGASITGVLDLSSHLDMGDSDVIKLGDGDDLQIYHSGSLNLIDAYTNNLQIRNGTSEKMAVFNLNGAVELYHDGELQAQTAGNGLRVKTAGDTDTELSVVGPEGRNGIINLEADDGDDNADIWGLVAGTDGKFLLRNYTAGSYENNLRATGNGSVELFYDNENRVETDSNGAIIQTNGDAYLTILADADNNNSNNWPLIDFRVNNMSGTTEARIAYREDNEVLKFDIAGSEKVGINGNGLVFNGDTAAANALDDYEEGSFTPTMRSSNNLPTFSYSHQRGKYVKVGRQVTVWLFVYATIGGTETGNLYIQDLPFIVRDEYAQVLITDSGNWSSFPSNHSGWGGYAQLNDDHIVMLTCGDKSAGGVHASNWGNDTYVYATMSYMTDS